MNELPTPSIGEISRRRQTALIKDGCIYFNSLNDECGNSAVNSILCGYNSDYKRMACTDNPANEGQHLILISGEDQDHLGEITEAITPVIISSPPLKPGKDNTSRPKSNFGAL